MSRPPQARSLATIDKVLDAAETLMERDGVGSLTMDAVALEARVSKGGVLHHFRSKDALVTAIAMRRLRLLEEEVDAGERRFAGEAHPTLRGMIDHARTTYCGDDSFSRPMLVAAVEHSGSLAQFQAMFADVIHKVRSDTAEPDLAAALLFATIGIQVTRTLGLAQLDAGQADDIFTAIAALTDSLPARRAEDDSG